MLFQQESTCQNMINVPEKSKIRYLKKISKKNDRYVKQEERNTKRLFKKMSKAEKAIIEKSNSDSTLTSNKFSDIQDKFEKSYNITSANTLKDPKSSLNNISLNLESSIKDYLKAQITSTAFLSDSTKKKSQKVKQKSDKALQKINSTSEKLDKLKATQNQIKKRQEVLKGYCGIDPSYSKQLSKLNKNSFYFNQRMDGFQSLYTTPSLGIEKKLTGILNFNLQFQNFSSSLRLVVKSTPGAGKNYMVYNSKDQVIFFQNEEQKANRQWSFIKYDVLDRDIQSGIYTSNIIQANLQELVNNSVTPSIDDLLTYMFTNIYGNTAYQTSFSSAQVYTTNFYDNYNFTSRTYNISYMPLLPTGFNNTLSMATTGLLTGTKIFIPKYNDEITQLLSVHFYNDRGLCIQTQSQNHKRGWDVATNSYDFNGKILGTIEEITNPLANDNQKVTLQNTFTYDHIGRSKSITHKINNNAPVTITTCTYDEIGRSKVKKLGNAAENLTYDYNIRGWLTGINKDYCLNANGGHFFGMELSYNTGYTKTYLNGNIAGMKWRNSGKADELRSYGYDYDDFSRLKSGDFVYKTTINPTWNNILKDYTENNITYDENGNIQSMKNMGLNVAGQKIILDDLNYNYQVNSNKLLSVTESSNSQSKNPIVYDKLGDFRDVAGANDYSYDNNGNVISDANKSLNFTYDFNINKPTSITKNGDQVSYIYDALGKKLQKKVVTASQTIIYDYIDDLTYVNNSLQLINHNEGQVKCSSSPIATYDYNYFIKDHLDNVRSVVSEEVVELSINDPIIQEQSAVSFTASSSVYKSGNLRQYTATSEIINGSIEQQLFDNVDNTRVTKSLTVNPNDISSAKLSSATNMIGPDITLKVMAGDKIKISTEALNLPNNNSNPTQIAQSVITNFINTYNGLPINVITEGGANAIQLSGQTTNNSIANAILQMQQQANNDPNTPMAFLNYTLLDEKMNLIPEGSGSIKVTNSNTWYTLETDTIKIPDNGFLRVFTSNISTIAVQFDNLIIKHWQGKLIEEFNYYPYGLMFDNTQAFNTLPNNFLLNTKELQHNEFGIGNGLEVYDFDARLYDVQIGRWQNMDPLADAYTSYSPYNYCYNNPISFTDPTGMGPEGTDGDPNKKERDVRTTPTGDRFSFIDETQTTSPKSVKNSSQGNREQAATSRKYGGDGSGSFADISMRVMDEINQFNPIANLWDIVSYSSSGQDRLGNDMSLTEANLKAASVMPIGKMLKAGSALLSSAVNKTTNALAKTSIRAFFSGAGTEARAIAAGFETLGQTKAGQNLQKLIESKNIPWKGPNGAEAMWKRLSTIWAKGIPNGSTVHVFLNNPRAESIWFKVELPILQQKGVKIIYK